MPRLVFHWIMKKIEFWINIVCVNVKINSEKMTILSATNESTVNTGESTVR